MITPYPLTLARPSVQHGSAAREQTEGALLILLDFDATLAPHVQRPDAVQFQFALRKGLAELIGHPKHRLAVFSRLKAAMVEQDLAFPDVVIIGSCGLEWSGQAVKPNWQDLKQLKERLAQLKGVQFEQGELGLVVRYPGLEQGREQEIETYLDSLDLPPGWSRRPGYQVREFLPSACKKERILRRLKKLYPQHHLVLIGNERSDPDSFLAVRRLGGTGLSVGFVNRPNPGKSVRALERLGSWAGDLD